MKPFFLICRHSRPKCLIRYVWVVDQLQQYSSFVARQFRIQKFLAILFAKIYMIHELLVERYEYIDISIMSIETFLRS